MRTSAEVHPTWRAVLPLSCIRTVRDERMRAARPKFLLCFFNAGDSNLGTMPPEAFRGMLILRPIHTPPFSNLYSRSRTLFFWLPPSVYLTHRMISNIQTLCSTKSHSPNCCNELQGANCWSEVGFWCMWVFCVLSPWLYSDFYSICVSSRGYNNAWILYLDKYHLQYIYLYHHNILTLY